VFDLAGRLRGMVVDCGDGYAAVTGVEVRRLLADTTAIAPIIPSAEPPAGPVQ
jgi:hypothetical protein